jgi:lipopolysaccharide transport system ATP-binding protein
MSDAVEIVGLGKRYTLAHSREPYLSFRDELARRSRDAVARILHPLASCGVRVAPDEFWALEDVSFEVRQGERIGIIGRNGAGKSTLLKILSRITDPTEGRVRIRGRVSSLLEVGTGFHPELTGRENVFLNGAILGMRRREILRKLDAIVAFADVERFLDTPVKRFSSGMYVRLAFSVAAHLEPEILIVDEVLAVGDAQFQRKCLGKMEEVGKEGRTVLFVSHNMAAIENLCQRAIVLDRGRVAFHGSAAAGIEQYLSSLSTPGETDLRSRSDRKGHGGLRVTRLAVADGRGQESAALSVGGDATFRVEYEGARPVANPRVVIGIYDAHATGVARFDTDVAPGLPDTLPGGAGLLACRVAGLSLTPGTYAVNIAIFGDGVMQDHVSGAIRFEVVPSDFFGNGRTFTEEDARLTKAYFRHDWSVGA